METQTNTQKEGGLVCKLVSPIAMFENGKGIVYKTADNKYNIALNGVNIPQFVENYFREQAQSEEIVQKRGEKRRNQLTFSSEMFNFLEEHNRRGMSCDPMHIDESGWQAQERYVGLHYNLAERENVSENMIMGGFHYIVPVIDGKPTMVIHSSSEKYGCSPKIAQIDGLPEGMEYL